MTTRIELDKETIITVSDRQPDGAFTAWFNDYDLDCMTGWGRTRVAAASDLLDKQNEARIDALAKQFPDEEPPQPVDDGSCDPLYGQRMDSADMGEEG